MAGLRDLHNVIMYKFESDPHQTRIKINQFFFIFFYFFYKEAADSKDERLLAKFLEQIPS